MKWYYNEWFYACTLLVIICFLLSWGMHSDGYDTGYREAPREVIQIDSVSVSDTGNYTKVSVWSLGKEYTVIQTVMYDDPSPVHKEKELGKSWVEDTMTWADVYSKKPEDYLEAIARGETPRWDSDAGKYVFGSTTESTSVIGGSKIVDPQEGQSPDDDMPF